MVKLTISLKNIIQSKYYVFKLSQYDNDIKIKKAAKKDFIFGLRLRRYVLIIIVVIDIKLILGGCLKARNLL